MRHRALALLVLLAAWAAVAYGNRAVEVMNPVLLPAPGEVVMVTVAALRDGTLVRNLVTSLARHVSKGL